MSASDDEVERFQKRNVDVVAGTLGGIAGVAASAATGLPIAGPLVAPFIYNQLKRLAEDFDARPLAPREQDRVMRAFEIGTKKLRDRINSGDALRTDGFFGSEPDLRSASVEVTEGALLSASRAYEEQKIKYIGNLIANLHFDDQLDSASANMLSELSSQLSYRGFVLLKVLSQPGKLDLTSRPENGAAPTVAANALFSELYSLQQVGLINQQANASTDDSYAVLASTSIEPCALRLTNLGEKLRDLLEVDEIPDDDSECIATISLLREAATYRPNSTIIDGGSFNIPQGSVQ